MESETNEMVFETEKTKEKIEIIYQKTFPSRQKFIKLSEHLFFIKQLSLLMESETNDMVF